MSQRETQGLIGSILIAAALIGLVELFSGCAGWQSTTRQTADGIGQMAARAPAIARGVCTARADACRAAGKLTPEGCPELTACHKAERAVNQATVGVQVAVLAVLSAVTVADKPSAATALVEAVRLVGEVRSALKELGVQW